MVSGLVILTLSKLDKIESLLSSFLRVLKGCSIKFDLYLAQKKEREILGKSGRRIESLRELLEITSRPMDLKSKIAAFLLSQNRSF